MNTFYKAFGRQRTTELRERKLTDLSQGIPAYIIFYQQATDDYLSNNYTSAFNNINKVIQQSDIDDWKHFAFRANIYETTQNYEKAIADYEKAIDFSSNDVMVYALYHQIGFCYLNLGNDKRAEEFYSYSLDLKLQHPNTEFNPDLEGLDGGVLVGIPIKRIYNNRANALKNQNKLNEAFEDCKKALSYDSNYSNTYLLLYQIFNIAGQKEEALKMLKHSAQLGNQNAIRMLNNHI